MMVVFWVFTPCRFLYLMRHFGVILPPSSGWQPVQADAQVIKCTKMCHVCKAKSETSLFQNQLIWNITHFRACDITGFQHRTLCQNIIYFPDTSNKNSRTTVKQWSQCSYNMTVRIREVSVAQPGFSRPSMTFAEATKFSCACMHNECVASRIMVISESLMLECAVYYFLSGIVHRTSDQSLCALYTAVKQHVGGNTRRTWNVLVASVCFSCSTNNPPMT